MTRLNPRNNAFARDDKGMVFSRDCPVVEIETPRAERVNVLVHHLKAKDRKPAGSDEKRCRKAAHLSQILQERDDTDRDFMIVAGDLNDEPTSNPLSQLRGIPGLHDVFDLVNRPADQRWTYFCSVKKAFNTIDYRSCLTLFARAGRPPESNGAGWLGCPS